MAAVEIPTPRKQRMTNFSKLPVIILVNMVPNEDKVRAAKAKMYPADLRIFFEVPKKDDMLESYYIFFNLLLYNIIYYICR